MQGVSARHLSDAVHLMAETVTEYFQKSSFIFSDPVKKDNCRFSRGILKYSRNCDFDDVSTINTDIISNMVDKLCRRQFLRQSFKDIFTELLTHGVSPQDIHTHLHTCYLYVINQTEQVSVFSGFTISINEDIADRIRKCSPNTTFKAVVSHFCVLLKCVNVLYVWHLFSCENLFYWRFCIYLLRRCTIQYLSEKCIFLWLSWLFTSFYSF